VPLPSTVVPDRAALLAAADAAVGTGTFAKLSHATVAKAAGVTVDDVRQAFPARRDLVEAICVERHHRWFADLRAAVRAVDEPRDRVLEVFTYLEADETGCCPCADTVGTGQHVVEALAVGHLVEVEQFIAELCEEAGLPRVVGDAVVLLVEGAAMTSKVRDRPHPVRAARTAAAMLIAVYEPTAAS
jgi:AcrR family transcriptional regulator